MKKVVITLSIIFILIFGVVVAKNFNKVDNDEKLTTNQKVDKLLSGMTLDEKIGQMLVIYYTSTSYDKTLQSAIRDVKPGGFILFKENITGHEQLTNYINGMQEDSEIPMFISIDQEGGLVQRLKTLNDVNITIIPPMEKLGQTSDENLAYEVGTVIGNELNAFGINMDFAPVIDINSNPNNTVIGDRSFGNSAELVSRMGIAVAKGLTSSGVIPVYKHFPGHGDTNEDSHYDLPVLTKTKEELYDLELKPFIEAINNDAKVIMIGHLAVPKITGDNTPASLSSKIIKDLLIEELGFKGLVVTDALNMGALTSNYSTEEILINTINAGVDMLLMPGSSKTSLTTIKKAIEDGKITEQQINNSVRKILTLKYESGLFEKNTKLDKQVLGSAEHQSIIDKIRE